MLNFLKPKSLVNKLNQTKNIKIEGIKFKIKKLNALDYLDGSRAMVQSYDEYAIKKSKDVEADSKKLRKHLSDVILAGTVEPMLTRKKEDEGLYIEHLFTDIDLANELYMEIMTYTYGKKKV